jgi:hypothetical protein
MEAQRVSIPCETCSARIGIGDEFCTGCGRPVTEVDHTLLRARLELSDVTVVQASVASSDYAAQAPGKKIRAAANWIGLTASLFVLGGALIFLAQQVEATAALAKLHAFEDHELLAPIHGKQYTAGALRAQIQRAPYQTLVINLVVAGLMGCLWRWAKRNPLPAIACAIALLIVVNVGSALVDPTTIADGLIIKILAFLALGKGLSAALAVRATSGRPSP